MRSPQPSTSKPGDQGSVVASSGAEKKSKLKRRAVDPGSERKRVRLRDCLVTDSEKHDSFRPSFDAINWNDDDETIRRFRAKVVVSHARENDKFERGEFAWEADAWRDVFGNLRDDDLIAM
jgi:hypothetical protein